MEDVKTSGQDKGTVTECRSIRIPADPADTHTVRWHIPEESKGGYTVLSLIHIFLSVFIFMPGLLVLFGPLIEKTEHKNFVPKIPFVGKIDYLTRWIIPPVFVVIAGFAFYFSNHCPYAYGYSALTKMCIRDRCGSQVL